MSVSDRRLEEAAMNAWPALDTYLLDGWVLRFANGYTKRANSINPTYPAEQTDLAAKVAACESIYASRGLPAIFRLTSFGVPPGLDELLATRGYRIGDPTVVLQKSLAGVAGGPSLRAWDVTAWLPVYCRLAGVELSAHGTHAAMLAKIPGDPVFATLDVADEPVACGLVVPGVECAGLFDIVTDRARRRRGYGRLLMTGLLSLAAGTGADTAYLQVVEANTGARHLYDQLGFTETYRYWYRLPPP